MELRSSVATGWHFAERGQGLARSSERPGKRRAGEHLELIALVRSLETAQGLHFEEAVCGCSRAGPQEGGCQQRTSYRMRHKCISKKSSGAIPSTHGSDHLGEAYDFIQGDSQQISEKTLGASCDAHDTAMLPSLDGLNGIRACCQELPSR